MQTTMDRTAGALPTALNAFGLLLPELKTFENHGKSIPTCLISWSDAATSVSPEFSHSRAASSISTAPPPGKRSLPTPRPSLGTSGADHKFKALHQTFCP